MCDFKIGDTYTIKAWVYDNPLCNDDSVPVLGEFRILQIIEEGAYWQKKGHWIAEKDGQVFLLRAIEVSGYWGGIKYQVDPIDTDALCRSDQKLTGGKDV